MKKPKTKKIIVGNSNGKPILENAPRKKHTLRFFNAEYEMHKLRESYD